MVISNLYKEIGSSILPIITYVITNTIKGNIALSLGLNYVPGSIGIWHTDIDKSVIKNLIKNV